MHLDALVEHRVRLSAEYLDRVAEVDEGLGEVSRVDALSADVWLAAVREVGECQRGIRREAGGPNCWHGTPPYWQAVTGR